MIYAFIGLQLFATAFLFNLPNNEVGAQIFISIAIPMFMIAYFSEAFKRRK